MTSIDKDTSTYLYITTPFYLKSIIFRLIPTYHTNLKTIIVQFSQFNGCSRSRIILLKDFGTQFRIN